MAKLVLNGETFDYDGTKQPMSEALAVERVYKKRYAEWQQELAAGNVLEAYCVLAWVIWRRDGREVDFDDIISGKADFDLNELLQSMIEDAEQRAAAQAAEEKPDPTGSQGPDGTPGTGTGTSGSSPATSESGPGKSVSSKSRTSKR